MATNVSVVTNNFVIKALPKKTYFQYDTFVDEQPRPDKRWRLINALQLTVAPETFHPRGVYDGNKLLYASHIIPDKTYRVHGSNQNAPPDARGWYNIKITRTAGKEVVPADINQLLVQGQATGKMAVAINMLQLLLCQAANLANPTNNKQAYFTPEGKTLIQGMAVELWRGFYQAVRPTIGRMIVNVDTTVAAMYMSGPLIPVAMAVLNVQDTRRISLRDPGTEEFKKLERYLKNRLIEVRTMKSVKTVRGLVPGPVGDFPFNSSGTGMPTTIAAHYIEAHNLILKHPYTAGVVTSGKSAPFQVVIPLELCSLRPGQLYKKKLPPQATSAVVAFAAMRPAERLHTIRMGGNQLRSPVQQYGQSEFMQDAGMIVDPNTIIVPGRLLKVPALLYNQRRVEPRDGAWNVLGSRFHSPRNMRRWGVVNFDTKNISPQVVQRTINSIVECCSTLGMNVEYPPQPAVRGGNGYDVKKVIAKVCQELGGEDSVDMIVILLPAKADEIRTLVKYFCDTELGVRSQCLRGPMLQKGSNQYFNNVALKFNARLGGANCLVDSPALKEACSKPLMIMGADVGHPGPGGTRPSVVSLVWSHDKYGAEYCAVTRVQAPRVEIIADLKDLVVIALEMFGQKHRTAPASIFFYRDGVSDGEFKQVQEIEIQAINDAFDQVWKARNIPSAKPRLTFIVVGKRHHMSFFPPTSQDRVVGDKTGNCRAGLVVDKGLAHPQFQDFYLQSHAAIKGTSRSAHYIVLQDENFEHNITKIQELSFALCHIYAKATRSVSIPAPVYYADLACARGKFHIDPASNMDLDASTTTGGQEDFDLERWKLAYRNINHKVQGAMYFL